MAGLGEILLEGSDFLGRGAASTKWYAVLEGCEDIQVSVRGEDDKLCSVTRADAKRGKTGEG